MLVVVKQVNEEIIERFFALYEESMKDLEANFRSLEEMKEAYASFLKDFMADPKQLVLVEEIDDIWASALRAVESADGRWFLEAVETKPQERKKGYGEALLHHTISHLRCLGMREVTCTIAKNNVASMALHRKCGFVPTQDAPINPWGQLENGTVLFRLK